MMNTIFNRRRELLAAALDLAALEVGPDDETVDANYFDGLELREERLTTAARLYCVALDEETPDA